MATKQWVSFNEDAHAERNRRNYVTNNGGSFTKTGKGWIWSAGSKPTPKKVVEVKTPAPTTSKKKKKSYFSKDKGES